MKLYHFASGDSGAGTTAGMGPGAGRFFCESLAGYLTSAGREAPLSILRGETPDMAAGPYGKPYLSGPEFEGVFFSRSNTRGHLVVCFSEGEIGVDCENTEARPGIESRYESIAGRFFTEDERAYIAPRAPGAAGRFFEIWTAKEAYMKYTGRGFAEGFRSFSVFRLPGAKIVTGRLKDAPHVVYSVCLGSAGAEASYVS